MNPQEKMAWYMLAVIVLAVVAYLVMYSLTGHPEASMAAFFPAGADGVRGNVLDRQKGQDNVG